MQVGLTVGVAGASGYAGGELLRLLEAHPEVELGPICAQVSAGQRVADVHPHLVSLADRVFLDTDPGTLAQADIVFLAMPHGASAALAQSLPDKTMVLDLGADFRLVDPAQWTRYYPGHPHAGSWAYGLPELPGQRARLAGQRRIALPGCYPTAVCLALAPLLAAGLVCPDDLVVVAASGTSGAGRSTKAHLLGSEVMGNLSAYKVAAHQHSPEICQTLTAAAGKQVTLSFTAVLAPMPRGMLATCTAQVNPGVTEGDLRDALAYTGEPLVHLLPADLWPQTAATVGSGSCHLQVGLDPSAGSGAGRAVIVSAIDNLGKGAAAQAVQVMNLLLGIPETTGIAVNGVAP